MWVTTRKDWDCKWIHVYDYTLDDIACFAHYGNTLMKINSRNAVRRVLYDSPRIADDDRRERLFA